MKARSARESKKGRPRRVRGEQPRRLKKESAPCALLVPIDRDPEFAKKDETKETGRRSEPGHGVRLEARGLGLERDEACDAACTCTLGVTQRPGACR